MPLYSVSRTYCTRMTWTVDAVDEEEALAKLDSDDDTPWEEGKEVWQGPYDSNDGEDLEDSVREVVL